METYTLFRDNIKVTVTNLGCAIINLELPDKHGNIVDIVLGLDKAEDYATVAHPFFGVVAGRFANRIRNGKFSLDGQEYQLNTNDGAHHLHGGNVGFDKKIWDVIFYNGTEITFEYNSPDGEENYPGNLNVKVTYALRNGTLHMYYDAKTDSKTICNLTNHSYFNLSGFADGCIKNHVLQIESDKITAVDEGLIPTGEFIDIAGTAFDFNTPKPIGQDMEEAGKANNTGGYDHNFVLKGEGYAASVYSPKTGIKMVVETNSPGMQLYTGNMIAPGTKGKGADYPVHSGFCLETQLFPDAINHPNFPSCIIEKGQMQKFYTSFEFSVIQIGLGE